MAAWWGWLGLSLLAGILLMTTGVQGTGFLTELRLCPQGPNQDQFIKLVCPADHLVIIVQASYRKSQKPGCHPGDPDSCLASDVSGQLTMPCFFRLGNCSIKLVRSGVPTCSKGGVTYQGTPYFHVQYKCEPLMLSSNPLSQTVDMCSDTEVSGSLVYLWNTNFPQYTTTRTCRCSVTVGPNTEMEIKLPHFKAHQQELDPTVCPQVMHFWSGSRVRSVCSEADDTFTPLEMEISNSLYIEFDNPAMKMTQFWITLGVHHSTTMSVRCGPNLRGFPPRPFPAILPSILPSTRYPARQPLPTSRWSPTIWTPGFTSGPWRGRPPGGSGRGAGGSEPEFSTPIIGIKPDMETATERQALHTAAHTLGYIPIIAAVVGATLVIVIIIMVVVFGCKRRRKRTQTPPAAAGSDPDYAFDNEIYMTEAARRRPTPAVSLSSAPNGPLPGRPQGTKAGGKSLLALEAPKGTVVPNPYAGIPADSPDHKAWDDLVVEKEGVDFKGKELGWDLGKKSVEERGNVGEKYWDKAEGLDAGGLREGASPSRGSLTSADYEDLAHFQETFKAMLKLKNSTTKSNETKLQLP